MLTGKDLKRFEQLQKQAIENYLAVSEFEIADFVNTENKQEYLHLERLVKEFISRNGRK